MPSLGWFVLGLEPVWQQGGGGISPREPVQSSLSSGCRLFLWSSIGAVLVIPWSFPLHWEDPEGQGLSLGGLGSELSL